jgi:hypothetical protein
MHIKKIFKILVISILSIFVLSSAGFAEKPNIILIIAEG